jgi:adenine-specific DNA methylase
VIQDARRRILKANGGQTPRVLDPFAGGGAISLEALRLGCETYAFDYNPVATLILKCTLEYPQKYGRSSGKPVHGLFSDKEKDQLSEDVAKWGKWVLDEAKKDIGEFYSTEKDGSIPVGYIWARTIQCQNPSCNAEIPLIQHYWLANRAEKKISLYPIIGRKEVSFKIVGTGYEKLPKGFNPEKGTVSRAIATCPICGSVIDPQSTRRLSAGGKTSNRMIAIISHKEGVSGKTYRVANEGDAKTFERADQYLVTKREFLMSRWGLDPVPDEPMPPKETLGFRVQRYGMLKWGDLFNSRQKLALITLVEKVRSAYDRMIDDGYDQDYAKAVATYLALIVSRCSDFESVNATWLTQVENACHIFARQAISLTWNYFELNLLSPVSQGTFESMHRQSLKAIEFLTKIDYPSTSTVRQLSATSLPYPDCYFDAVFTDPPYYDNVPYSHLSDFFYVWLKRAVGDLYPELFATLLTPKTDEIVAYANIEGGFEAGKALFENMLKTSFKEINRVLKPDGVSAIVYAHKSFAGWETLVNSLLDSGLVVTGAWPIHTEMRGRLRAQESAALASSIYMIARKYPREKVGFYSEVKHDLQQHLNSKLDSLWNEGISGADFFIAAIGSSIQIYGKYERIIDDAGDVIRADKLLEDVRRIVTDYAVKQVLHNGFAAEITPLTRFYLLWRWGYGDMKLKFDDALKLARGVGMDLAQEWNRGFIRKDKEFVRILGPEDRDVNEVKASHELIDVLHNVLLLWNKGKNDEAVNLLKETGYGKSDVFYRVAQAIAESLTDGREKKLLEIFLSGKERITANVRQESVQTRLL